MSEALFTKSFYCAYQHKISGSYYTIIPRCFRICSRFPCRDLKKSDEIRRTLSENFTETVVGLERIKGGRRMYLFKKGDEMTEAPKDFDPNKLGQSEKEILQGVDEVLFVSKRYVPTVKLVPVGKEKASGKR